MSEAAAREQLQHRLGYRFRDASLLDMALTHRSWANEQGVEGNYERVEFLGDAVLGLVVAQRLYVEFPELAEGDLSKLKSQAVNEPVLADWAASLGLGEVMRLGVGEQRSGGGTRTSLLADALEAVVGAVFLDGGLTAARRVIRPWLDSALATELASLLIGDAKTTLQELVQGRGLELPEYRHVAEEGPDHRKRFHVECWVSGERLGVGAGPSKKEAEQRAARTALAELERETVRGG